MRGACRDGEGQERPAGLWQPGHTEDCDTRTSQAADLGGDPALVSVRPLASPGRFGWASDRVPHLSAGRNVNGAER